MTALSMNAAFSADYHYPAARRTLTLRMPAALDHASGLVAEWCIENLPDMAGCFALALVPFSSLAWLFIAR